MGRFDTTAQTYADRREPYPPSFFAAVAEKLGLNGREALIDLGTGPGLLALGFRPYVRSIVGVDPEPAMVAEARQAALAAKVDFPVIDGRAEDLPAGFGPFDLITIGRALHWMDRPATLAAFERILAPAGRILICGSNVAKSDANPWLATYDRTVRAWGEDRVDERRRIHEWWFEGTRYARIAEIKVAHRQPTTPEALFERALTRSTSSRAVLGARIDSCRQELLAALAPFFPAGEGEEVVEAKAHVFAVA